MNIEVKIPLGVASYTPEQLSEEIKDLMFLRAAFLVVLNPEYCAKSDMAFNLQDTIKYAKEMYDEQSNGWSKEFIEKCFAPRLNAQNPR